MFEEEEDKLTRVLLTRNDILKLVRGKYWTHNKSLSREPQVRDVMSARFSLAGAFTALQTQRLKISKLGSEQKM